MLTRPVLMIGAAALILVFVAGSGDLAWADGGGSPGSGGTWGNVNCAENPYPGCQLSTGTTNTGRVTPPATGGTSRGGSDGSGPPQFSCLNLMPYVSPSGPLSPPAGQTASSGGWYVSVCSGFRLGMPGGGVFYPPVWISGQPNPPAPREVARRAENQLDLPSPVIEMSPAGQQLVNLPTWLAIDRAGYTARSATASVAGVSVTATATPTSVVWSTGDGTTVTCAGPGTVFHVGDDPSSPSPTCGHTYRVSSASQPGAVFAVTVTAHWSVSWAGAGQSGRFADLTTTATARVPVAESQALNTR